MPSSCSNSANKLPLLSDEESLLTLKIKGLEQLKVVYFATQGEGGSDERRIRFLLSDLESHGWAYCRNRRWTNFFSILRHLAKEKPDLVVMEGTGIPGGAALLMGRLIHKIRYVVSSGDAVAPFLRTFHPVLGWIGWFYEAMLCRFSAGFIGWTPYLVGRALTFGAPRAMTAAGFAPFASIPNRERERRKMREKLRIPDDALVIGIAGSIQWNRRVGYCYGLELIQALAQCSRQDLFAVIIGDGSGLDHLKQQAKDYKMEGRICFTGRVPFTEVSEYLVGFDIGSLPQSTDRIGSFRYTTKISEYITAGLPIVCNAVPLSYDLDTGWIKRFPGGTPWDPVFIRSLSLWLDHVSRAQLLAMQKKVPMNLPEFDGNLQKLRVKEFVQDLLLQDRISRDQKT